MPKTNIASSVFFMLTLAIAGACNAQDGIQTVDALLAAENKAILEKLKVQAEALTPQKPVVNKKPQKVWPAAFNVKAVYGLSGGAKTDLSYEGQPFFGMMSGNKVGPCKISEIRGMCVAMIPSDSKVVNAGLSLAPGEVEVKKKARSERSNSPKRVTDSGVKAPTSKDLCPSACWSAPVALIPAQSNFPSSSNGPRFAPPSPIGNQRNSTPVLMQGQGQGLGNLVSPAQNQVRMSATLSGASN